MGQIKKNTLGYMGPDYQYRLVSAFIDDPKFFKGIYQVVDQNAFTEVCLRTIVGIMKDYFSEYECSPSYEMIDICLKNRVIRTDDDEQYYSESLEKLKKMGTEGHEEVKKRGIQFFMQQSLIKAANQVMQIAGDGDASKYEECRGIIEKAITLKINDDEMSSPFENIDDDLNQQHIVSIPTGIDRLDEALGGGLDKGKVGLIIAPTGVGKTSMTTCMAANAATCKCEANDYEGFKVLQLVFEDTHRDIHRKYISRVSNVETCHLNDSEEVVEQVKTILNNSEDRRLINENVRIIRLETGEKSMSDIKTLIKQKINEGFKPDLVIIDYFECVAPEYGVSKSDVTEREAATMRKLENLAPELDIAVWIPTQGNRESMIAELVTSDKVGGSIKKTQIAQVILTVSKSVDDGKHNKATIALLKNRSGLSNVTLNGVYFNNGTCRITTDEVEDFDDVFSYNEFATDKEIEIEKEMIRNQRLKFKLEQNSGDDFDIPI